MKKILGFRSAMETQFRKGMEVEVFSDDKDLRGALFQATVIRSVSRRNKVLIEYRSLVADEEGNKPLREMVDEVFLRPIPPRESDRRFVVSDLVDAYHNDGWWEGVVIRVVEKGRYLVYFRPSKEEIEFQECEMRIHREWVKGVWVPAMEEDHKIMEMDTATLQNKTDLRNDQSQFSHVYDTADIVNGSNTRNGKIKLPSCNIIISSPCKMIKKEVSERSLVREPVPRFGEEKTGGVLGHDRSAGHPMLDDFSLSPVDHIEEDCTPARSQGQYSQNKLISQSCKNLKKETWAGNSFPTDTEKSTSAILGPLKQFSAYPEPKEKNTTTIQYDSSGGYPMLNGFNLSPLCNFEEHCESSNSQEQYSHSSSVAQSINKSTKGDETGSSFVKTPPAKGSVTIALPSSELSAELELKEKTNIASRYDRSLGHQMLDDFNLSPVYNIEEHRKLSKSRAQYSQNNLSAQSCKKSKKGNEPGSSFPATHHSGKMCRSAIRIGNDFDNGLSASVPTFDDFGLSPLLDMEEQRSDSCIQVHSSQNNLIQY